ncbi:MAG: hypothetical protein JNK40_12375 [Chromatiales bacterium]|nr:hypothetical protein [Chromatiales bacterium]
MTNLNQTKLYWIALGLTALLATGCKKKGPVEQMGEEVDEAVDTLKKGEESTATKLDDAVDELTE